MNYIIKRRVSRKFRFQELTNFMGIRKFCEMCNLSFYFETIPQFITVYRKWFVLRVLTVLKLIWCLTAEDFRSTFYVITFIWIFWVGTRSQFECKGVQSTTLLMNKSQHKLIMRNLNGIVCQVYSTCTYACIYKCMQDYIIHIS